MEPNQQQAHIAERVLAGESVKVIARAGTGKTTTLRWLAGQYSASVLYVVYNRRARDEAAAKMPANVTVVTAHQLASRRMVSRGPFDRGRLVKGVWALRQPLRDRAGDWLQRQARETGYDPDQLMTLVLDTLNRFLLDQTEAPQANHIPDHLPTEPTSPVASVLLAAARQVWAWQSDPSDTFPILHDTYLKLFQLRAPRLDYELVFFDEAQDANPAMAAIVRAQQHCQQAWVGDPFQQVYGFRGAINAMEALDLPALPLTQSYRFGPAVAGLANRLLEGVGAPYPLAGHPEIRSRIRATSPPRHPQPEVVLTRSNAGAVEEALDGIQGGERVAVVGGIAPFAALLRAAFQLRQGQSVTHSDLAAFPRFDDLAAFAETDAGQSFRPLVRLVKEHGRRIPRLAEVLETGTVPEDAPADRVVATAHRFKGLQAPVVRLKDDFPTFHDPDTGLNREEANLGYVALTRAERVLDYAGYAPTLEKSLKGLAADSDPQGQADQADAPVVDTTRPATLPRDSHSGRMVRVRTRSRPRGAKGYPRWVDTTG